jgi:virginiamycin B lyase
MILQPSARPLGALVATVVLAVFGPGCSGTQDRAAVMPAVQSVVQRAERPKIREFDDLLGQSYPYSPSAIASGPKRDLWVTDDVDPDYGESAVVQLATSCARRNVFYYSGVLSQGSSFADITQGPDGALWITDTDNHQILRMATDGTYTGFPLGSSGDYPLGIAAGPDGALWFVVTSHAGAPAVGRITTSGTITSFSSGITPGAYLQDIAVGPDGAMWFTETNTDKIGRINMRGKVTEYSNGITSGAQPYSITAGPDKAVWFTEFAGGRIGRITTKGRVTEYSKGITPTQEPWGIAAGPDKALWFTEIGPAAKIGRITSAGSIREYSGFNQYSGPTDIIAGHDGNMWFVETISDELARVRL